MSCLNSTKDNEDCSYIESRNSEMSSKRSIIVGILQGVDARAVHIADTSQHHPGLPKSDSFVAPGDSNTSDLKLETGKKIGKDGSTAGQMHCWLNLLLSPAWVLSLKLRATSTYSNALSRTMLPAICP